LLDRFLYLKTVTQRIDHHIFRMAIYYELDFILCFPEQAREKAEAIRSLRTSKTLGAWV
jgi:hypothetical protein